jgi:hypothetical protein
MSNSLAQRSAIPAGLQVAPGEIVLLQDRNVFVTNLRCIFTSDARIHASSGITSVGIISSKEKWAGAVFCAIIAAIILANAGSGGILGAAILILFAIFFWLNGRPKHHLSLHTSGISYTPLWSRDRAYVGSVVIAINNAIIARG